MYVREDIWFVGQRMKSGTLDHAVGYCQLFRDLLWVEQEGKVIGFGTGCVTMIYFTVFMGECFIR